MQEARLPPEERQRTPLIIAECRILAAGDRWLDASVHVSDWMARQGSALQQRVDALVAIVRNDDPCPAEAAAVGIDRGSIQAELCQLRTDLAELEASLVRDVIVVATHPEIQTFDISLQRIDRMLKRLCIGG